MRLPRDLSREELASRLARLGYKVTRQTGSHLRLTTQESGEHHITIPRHAAPRAGTLAAILRERGEHHKIGREDLLRLVS